MSVVEAFDRVIVFLSFVGIVVGIVFLLINLAKSINKKEPFFAYGGILIAFFLRLKYGLFGPWYAEDHHVELILSLIKNKEEGSFFLAPYLYGGQISGGLFDTPNGRKMGPYY